MSGTPSPSAWDRQDEFDEDRLLLTPSPFALLETASASSRRTPSPTTPFPPISRPSTPLQPSRSMATKPSASAPSISSAPVRPSQPYRTFRCLVCETVGHIAFRCPHFAPLSVEERWGLVESERRCANCLSSRHFDGVCASQKRCANCGMAHHTMLHGYRPPFRRPFQSMDHSRAPASASLKRPAPFGDPSSYPGLSQRYRCGNPRPAGYEGQRPFGYGGWPRFPTPLIPCSPAVMEEQPPANPWWSEDPLFEFGFDRRPPRSPSSSPPLSVFASRPGTPPVADLWDRHVTAWDPFDPYAPRRYRAPSPAPLIEFSPPGSPLIRFDDDPLPGFGTRGRGFRPYDTPSPQGCPSPRPGPALAVPDPRVATLARGREARRRRNASRAMFRGSRRLGPSLGPRPSRSPPRQQMPPLRAHEFGYLRTRLPGSSVVVMNRPGWFAVPDLD